MKYILFCLFCLFFACKQSKKCEFSTVKELDEADFIKCPPDSMFIYMRFFSGGFDSIRRIKGIPVLPKNFHSVVYTVDNQVRWLNRDVFDDSNYTQPFIHHKDIEWSRDTLKYDLTSFSANDTLNQYTGVIYWLDTISSNRDYKFTYYYLNKYFQGDSSLEISKHQSDSILMEWGLKY